MTTPLIPGLEPTPARREWTLLAVIFGVLVALITIPFLMWQYSEQRRPSLAEIRVVSATGQDPVFREGARTVGPEEQVSLAIALRLEYPGKGSRWLAPVDRLELDGVVIDHLQTEAWPEHDRTARTFWFTLESPFLGGTLDTENALSKLAARPFLAPELGHGFLAQGQPAFHAADGINLGNTLVPVDAGTFRVYARVEVVADEGTSRPLFTATSLGADRFDDPSMVRISRALAPSFAGLDPESGHLFRLPGFEATPSSGWNAEEACTLLVATSSRTFALMAATGMCAAEDRTLVSLGRLSVADSEVTPVLRWQSDLLPGDLFKQGDHWMVAVSDDGNGLLDGTDLVAHSWRRPAGIMPLASALDDQFAELDVFRAEER